MKKHTTFAFFVSLILFVVSNSVQAFEHNKRSMDFEVISQGGQSGVDHQMLMVVDNAMHWEHLWKMHTDMQVNTNHYRISILKPRS